MLRVLRHPQGNKHLWWYFSLSFFVSLHSWLLHRTKNFESSKAYKATWGDGGDNSPSNIVSKQPGRVTNGQPQQATAGAASGGYIKRYASSSQYFYPFPEGMSLSGGWVYLSMNCNLSVRNSIYSFLEGGW